MNKPDPYATPMQHLVNLVLLIIPIIVLLIVCASARGQIQSSLGQNDPPAKASTSVRINTSGTLLFGSRNHILATERSALIPAVGNESIPAGGIGALTLHPYLTADTHEEAGLPFTDLPGELMKSVSGISSPILGSVNSPVASETELWLAGLALLAIVTTKLGRRVLDTAFSMRFVQRRFLPHRAVKPATSRSNLLL